MPASPLPPQDVRDDITTKLADLVRALQSHPSFTPPEPPRGLFHVWDFVNRSRYIMEELENIRQGKTLRHPEQIPKHDKTTDKEEKAREAFTDVVTRSLTINEMIQKPQMLVMLGMSQIDFGEDVRTKADAVTDAIRAASA